jgi:predicted GH43/DUF377 family glycosyl hydrolase
MNTLIRKDRVLLRPSDLQPLCPECEVVGVFNPAAAHYNGDIILLVRVVEQPHPQRAGQLLSPRAVWQDERITWELDALDLTKVDTSDPRLIYLPDGRVRLRYISHLRLVRLNTDGTRVEEVRSLPDLLPREPWEECGIEDPRITQIGHTYYITYVAISRQMGIATALMTTHDFQTFERHGIIFPTENKNVVLLPEKWQGYFVAYHRPVSYHWLDAPSIEVSISPDAIFWGKHQLLISPRPESWDSVKIGAGAPPVRLPQGWLLLYHGVSTVAPRSPAGRYCVGAALLDGENPLRLLARSKEPLLCPERPYERRGYVPDVVFPTGALLSEDGKTLLLFVGAADEVTALLHIPVGLVLHHLGITQQ